MVRYPSLDRDLLSFLRAAISEAYAVRARTLDTLAEANRLMRLIEKIESPLIGSTPRRPRTGGDVTNRTRSDI